MARRLTGLLALLCLATVALPGQAQTRYWLTFPQAAQHYVRVEAHYPTGGAAQVDLFLPTWTPGDYVIRDFSQFLGRIGGGLEA
jgi:predicted metalloprotease with PDZ domain